MKSRVCRIVLLPLAVFTCILIPAAHAQNFIESVLYNFCSQGGTSCTDGSQSYGGLVQGADGSFYGTTYAGGAYGFGSIFKITPAGAFTTLYSFCSQSGCLDGEQPMAGLTLGSDENFYGTTYGGGNSPGSVGTIFEITSSGTFTSLYSFCKGTTDCTVGANPIAGLIEDSAGNFYGATQYGGNNDDGVLFRITPSGALPYTVLYSFCAEGGNSCTDGKEPYGNLVLDSVNYTLYGTTQMGGADGQGTVFAYSASSGFSVLHSFGTQANDGEYPQAGLVAAGGNYYGTTTEGGVNGPGEVFEITPAGTVTTFYSFCKIDETYCEDGSEPDDALILGKDGNFYGTTYAGGSAGTGTVFQLTPAGVLTTLYSFASNGTRPNAGVVQGTDGNFYGATTLGGNNSEGVVYKLALPATTAALAASPNPAGVGQTVTLTATVTGSNGTPAGTVTFSVDGASIGAKTLSGGVATLSASSNGIAPGTYPVVATYSGSSSYGGSASSATSVVLEKAATSTTLTASPTTVNPPTDVALAATVKRSASGSAGTPTGTVTFYYGTLALGTVTLTSGTATLAASTNGVPANKYVVDAKYNGDSSDAASTSSAVTVTVE